MGENYFTELISKHQENGSLPMVNLGKLAAKIAFYNFEWRFITLVIFNTMHVAASLENFLITYNRPIALKFGNFVPRRRVKISQFVIFGHDTNELVDILAWLAKCQYDVSAKIIIVCANDDHKRCDKDEAFPTISKVFMVNSVFLSPTEGKNEPSTFTYYPMKPNKCTNNIPEEINIDLKCSNHSCLTAFPEKLDNFFGCTLYISTIHQPPYMHLRDDNEDPYGADADVIKVVANILNATLKVKLPLEKSEWGHSVDNNWTGSLGDVFNKRVHASMASIPLTANKHGNFQISFPYYSMEMVWATKLPDLKPTWEKLLRPLKIITRVVLFVIFMFIVMIDAFLNTKIWHRIRKSVNVAPSKSNLLFKSFILFLGMSVSRMPTKSFLRIIVYSWIWFSLEIRCAYQATLFDSLKTSYYEEPFTGIRDIIKAGYMHGGPTSLRDYYTEEPDIFKDWKLLKFDNIYDTLAKVTNCDSHFAVASNKASILHLLLKSNGSKHLQIIPERIVTSPTVLYFKKFSSFVPAINRILSVLVEAGFTDKFYAQYLNRDNYLLANPPGSGPAPLGFDHFATCFMFLAIGWLISAIYFAIEMLCKPPRE